MAIIARQNNPPAFVVAPIRALANQTILQKVEASRFADYVAQDKLLDGGEIVVEAYPNMRPWQRHFAWASITVQDIAKMLVIEAVACKPYALALQELVWGPIESEADALVAISKAGYTYSSVGLHARLRDIARFGQIYWLLEPSGVPDSAHRKMRALFQSSVLFHGQHGLVASVPLGHIEGLVGPA
jgi:CubicO group peptidase (beta-lactamase class C family)